MMSRETRGRSLSNWSPRSGNETCKSDPSPLHSLDFEVEVEMKIFSVSPLLLLLLLLLLYMSPRIRSLPDLPILRNNRDK